MVANVPKTQLPVPDPSVLQKQLLFSIWYTEEVINLIDLKNVEPCLFTPAGAQGNLHK